MKRKIIILILIISGALLAAYFDLDRIKQGTNPPITKFDPQKPDTVTPTHVLLNVPFTSQAPLGHWEDPRQEDGCEEASILMAWLWTQNQTITPAEAEKTIIDMSEFELKQYGNYHDFNANDTATLMKDYYKYDQVKAVMNPTVQDIKNELAKDHLVLVPANGIKLANPHFKTPGPLTHMIVIKGFDDSSQEFTTNDPGTKFGESYIYSYDKVFRSMVDYPSGIHESQEGRGKSMIVIQK